MSADRACRDSSLSLKTRDIRQLGPISSDLSLALATSWAHCEEQVRDVCMGDWPGGGVLVCLPQAHGLPGGSAVTDPTS